MNRISALSITLMIAFSSCAIFPKAYVEPDTASNQTATLTISNTSDELLRNISIYEDGTACSKRFTLNNIPAGEQKTFRSMANRSMAFGMELSIDHVDCAGMMWSFSPQEGSSYSLEFHYDGMPSKCYVRAMKNGEPLNMKVLPEHFIERQPDMPWDENGYFCKAL